MDTYPQTLTTVMATQRRTKKETLRFAMRSSVTRTMVAKASDRFRSSSWDMI